MRFQSTVAIGLCASAASAAYVPCGTSGSAHALRDIAEEENLRTSGLGPRGANKLVTIDTYVHAVATSKKEEDGYLSDKTVQREISLLNEAFKPHNFAFKLIKTTRNINGSWAEPVGGPGRNNTEPELRAALRKGGYDDLNLFYILDMPPGGKCELPIPNPTSQDIINDGCIMKPDNLGEAPLKYGSTTIHEVGHWLGLEHTFENGCNEPGDGVDDTPYERIPPFGECPEPGRDTCPDKPGLDPVDNYMSYVEDSCGPKKFTPGQTQRMHSLWKKLRLPYKMKY
ncbi:hypothetical protein F66182_2266 [Fusarium sp. NRRL 66182]|nr:hypothetical protein F66182_2266 [Fusarium sp. NRRL 66182]